MSTFGKTVRTLREALGMAIKELAYDSGCSYNHLVEIELGRRSAPSMKRVLIMSSALCCGDQGYLCALALTERYPELFDAADVEEIAGIIRRRLEARRELGKEELG